MNPPSSEEVLFQQALARPAEQRAAFLDAKCGQDAALRRRLEALLTAHEQPETALEWSTPRREALPESPPSTQGATEFGPPKDTPDEAVGLTLGRYKLLERLGEGGCGVVYVAEQTEPVRRRVALKVMQLPPV